MFTYRHLIKPLYRDGASNRMRSMNSPNNVDIHRLSHQDRPVDMPNDIRTRIEGYVIGVMERSLQTLETDLLKSSFMDLEAFLHEAVPSYPYVTHFRAVLGGVQDTFQKYVKHDYWRQDFKIHDISHDILFSIDVIDETLQRVHDQSIQEFIGKWHTIDRNESAPINMRPFLMGVLHAQHKQHIKPFLQQKIFQYVEKDVVKTYGLLLFELNSLIEAPQPKQTSFALGSADDERLFNSLCGLLESWQPTADLPKSLQRKDLIAIISNLQHWVPTMLEEALGDHDGQVAQCIRDSILDQAKKMGLAEQPTISEEDSHAVQLVDEVFAHNLYERKLQQASRSILAQILFPSVKAAILNRRWFEKEQHPARQFISSMSDICAPVDGNPSPQGLEHASQTVDRLISGFNEDVSVFEVLTEDIRSFVVESFSPVQIPVQPVVQTKRDAPKMVLDEHIVNELKQRWNNWKGPSSTKSFTIFMGSYYLSYLLADNAKDTARWQQFNQALDMLMNLTSHKDKKIRIDGFLRDRLLDMMEYMGWSGVKAHHILAEQEDIIHAYWTKGTDHTDDRWTLSEKYFDEEMSAFKTGQMFQWLNADNIKQNIKLSWISPISKKILFVDASGSRVLVTTFGEMQSFIDDGTLKQL